jgi:hypothetical protein
MWRLLRLVAVAAPFAKGQANIVPVEVGVANRLRNPGLAHLPWATHERHLAVLVEVFAQDCGINSWSVHEDHYTVYRKMVQTVLRRSTRMYRQLLLRPPHRPAVSPDPPSQVASQMRSSFGRHWILTAFDFRTLVFDFDHNIDQLPFTDEVERRLEEFAL